MVHHGALGSFATVYLEDGLSGCDVISKLAAISGIEKALTNTEGCALFQLPKDRMGDLLVVSERSMVLGTTRERHDFSGLDVPLRSHGGISEQVVPLICSKPVSGLEDKPDLSSNCQRKVIPINRIKTAIAQPIIGGNAPAAPPMTIFCGVFLLSQIV